MKIPADILDKARKRAQELNLPYAGALLPQEAFELLKTHSEAKLIDVRTRAELDWVGRVPGSIEIEWNTWPGSKPNPEFIAQLKSRLPESSPALFLCRSGVRSHNAAVAATQAGYSQSFNVLQGFEGDKDEAGHRNTIGGWRATGLPWTQS
jgi:rhodanese-related sulfurtransferase